MTTEKTAATLLIVDGEPDNLVALGAVISEHLRDGCRIVTARGAVEGLAIAADDPPDGALVDVQMPHVDGVEMCRRLRACPATADVPVVLMADCTFDADMCAAGLEAGALDFVRKPIDDMELIARVHAMLRVRRAEDELRRTGSRLESLLKRRTRDLVNNEYYYRTLLQSLHEDIIVIDTDHVITDVNNAYLATMGHRRRDTVGKRCFKVAHGHDAPCDRFGERCPLPEVLRTGLSAHCRHTHTRADGTTTHVDIVLSPLTDEDGNITHVIEAVRDITDLVEAQEKLTGEHALLNAVVEGTDDAIFVKDMQGRYLMANAATCRTMRKTPEQVLGKNDGDIFPPDIARRVKEFDELVLTSGRSHVMEETIHIDGTEMTWLTSKFPRRDADGAIIGLMGIARDITDRKRMEEELVKSEKLYREAQSLAHIGHWDYEPIEDRLSWSEEVYSIFEIDKDAGPLSIERFLERIHPSDRNIIREQIEQGKSYRSDYRIVMDDGSIKHVHEEIPIVRRKDGKVVRMRGTLQDITERKLLEEEYRQAQKMEAVGQLAGGVAHDFRNQLTVIKGYGERLLRRSLVSDEGVHAVGQILKAVDRSATLTAQLLAFSRREALCPQTVDLCEILHDMAKMLPQMVGDDISVTIVAGSSGCWAKVDPGLLQQAIMNLVVNACHTMPDGGKLTIEANCVDVDGSAAGKQPGVPAGPYVVVAVSDIGSGMDTETLARAFEPFFTTKEAGEGTGMGLALVHGFVAQSGGFIEVDSEVGRGSTFSLHFPRAEPPEPADTPRMDAQGDQVPGGTETVLVVEDEEPVRHLTVTMLRECGYTVLEAGNADEALPLGEHYKGEIDMLVTDVIMPGMSGPQLARCLQRARPGLAVLLISGYGERIFRRRNNLEPGMELLLKPYSRKKLAETVRRLLDGKTPG